MSTVLAQFTTPDSSTTSTSLDLFPSTDGINDGIDQVFEGLRVPNLTLSILLLVGIILIPLAIICLYSWWTKSKKTTALSEDEELPENLWVPLRVYRRVKHYIKEGEKVLVVTREQRIYVYPKVVGGVSAAVMALVVWVLFPVFPPVLILSWWLLVAVVTYLASRKWLSEITVITDESLYNITEGPMADAFMGQEQNVIGHELVTRYSSKSSAFQSLINAGTLHASIPEQSGARDLNLTDTHRLPRVEDLVKVAEKARTELKLKLADMSTDDKIAFMMEELSEQQAQGNEALVAILTQILETLEQQRDDAPDPDDTTIIEAVEPGN